jgi:hypothetical protein
MIAVMRLRTIALPALTAATLTGCGGERVVAWSESRYPVRLMIQNRLAAPVVIAVDGSALLGLDGGESGGLTVPASAQWLTWNSAKPMDNTGKPIPDDIPEIAVSIGGINRTLDISNVIQDRTYITARFFNGTAAAVSIGVFDGSTVACAAVLPPVQGQVAGYTQIGYYRLLPTTEIRAYRDPAGCMGPYAAWPAEDVRKFQPGTGQVTLFLLEAP